MEQHEGPENATVNSLWREQLLVYARELGEHFRQEHELQLALAKHEEQLRELAAACVAAQEEERQWIAYEVHDRITQTLAAVFQQLQTLESLTQADPAVWQVVVRTSVLAREAIRESRNIMNDLHPPLLDEFGVAALIEEELRRFQEDTGCQTKFDDGSPQRPSKDVEVALYRIFHEALVNVRRHAQSARNVGVHLASWDHTISLHVQDDGPGFDVEAAMQRRRVGGLLSMRRRVEIIGGTFELISAPGTGTTVAVRAPLPGGNGRKN